MTLLEIFEGEVRRIDVKIVQLIAERGALMQVIASQNGQPPPPLDAPFSIPGWELKPLPHETQ
jgi:chorismate mutase